MLCLVVIFFIFNLYVQGASGYKAAAFRAATKYSNGAHFKGTRLFAGFGSKKESTVASSSAPQPSSKCACGSGLSYGDCCMPYHSGKEVPPNPVKVVRSRFSALAYKVIPYLITTTHKSHKEFADEDQKSKRKVWEKDLKAFADEYKFVSLEFDNEERDSVVSGDATTATVSFTAKLQRLGLGDRPAEDMKEISTFKRDKPGVGPWLYADAVIKNPFKNISPDVKPQQRAVKTLKKGVPNGNQG